MLVNISFPHYPQSSPQEKGELIGKIKENYGLSLKNPLFRCQPKRGDLVSIKLLILGLDSEDEGLVFLPVVFLSTGVKTEQTFVRKFPGKA